MNDEIKRKILRMFDKPGSISDCGAGESGAKAILAREAVELLAPVFWLTSFTRLIDVLKQVFMFWIGAVCFYQIFHWLLTGVPASWWLVLQVPLVLFGLLVALLGVLK
ncbi:MAG: hypothetical protein B7X93_03065 [Hydrogenophilales bacterium 17-61-9]|nr:MAG: hypothetical protein B7X93_03065 [Hydrogenophilales bacterium 17-61-9]